MHPGWQALLLGLGQLGVQLQQFGLVVLELRLQAQQLLLQGLQALGIGVQQGLGLGVDAGFGGFGARRGLGRRLGAAQPFQGFHTQAWLCGRCGFCRTGGWSRDRGRCRGGRDRAAGAGGRRGSHCSRGHGGCRSGFDHTLGHLAHRACGCVGGRCGACRRARGDLQLAQINRGDGGRHGTWRVGEQGVAAGHAACAAGRQLHGHQGFVHDLGGAHAHGGGLRGDQHIAG